jgi:hypothetical protein
MEEQKKKTAPKFDSAKSSKTGDTLAVLITGTIVKARPQSIAEGLLIITLAVGRTIQCLGTIMGVDPKIICKDFCESLTKYFEMGGDGRIDDIAASMKQKGN